MGSSPLTRGAPYSTRKQSHELGLIPAHAGSTSLLDPVFEKVGAHPRSRGEHYGNRATGARESGSSPLTRGARYIELPENHPWRLIPAHAGSTGCHRGHWFSLWAHPRSRGEHTSWAMYSPGRMGSSPLTRGAPLDSHCLSTPTRLIPAHAGSTPAPAPLSITFKAHPRSRGEHIN